MANYAESTINQQTKSLRRSLVWVFIVLAILQVVVYTIIIYYFWGESLDQWAFELIISTLFLIGGLLTTLQIIKFHERKTTALIRQAVDEELDSLRAVQSRYESLLAMTTSASTTPEPMQLLQIALELCELRFVDTGSAEQSTTSIALLFDKEGLLKPLVGEGLSEQDREASLTIDEGIIARCLEKLEPAVSDQINHDPVLAKLTPFADSLTGLCLPLLKGQELFGLIILASSEAITLDDDDLAVLKSMTDLTIPAMQIDRLNKDNTAESWNLLRAEDAERLAIARTLRDGPAQQVTGGAMRLGFIHERLDKNPSQALVEVKKIEVEFRESAKELREMAFLLRPMLNIMGKRLDQAIREMILRIHKIGNLQVAYNGGKSGQALPERDQLIVHYIVEAALFWAQNHGRASRASVQLNVQDGLFIARIEDNGSGGGWFQESQSRSKRDLPMIIMRERARRIGGSLEVARGPAGGRVVTLSVPLDKNGQRQLG